MAYVTVVVQSRLATFDDSLEEAALDLGARPAKVFFRITLPLILPAILSGWLLAFTLSWDDLVISQFVAGPGSTTLPMVVFSKVRLGVSPDINALATIMVTIVGTGRRAVGALHAPPGTPAGAGDADGQGRRNRKPRAASPAARGRWLALRPPVLLFGVSPRERGGDAEDRPCPRTRTTSSSVPSASLRSLPSMYFTREIEVAEGTGEAHGVVVRTRPGRCRRSSSSRRRCSPRGGPGRTRRAAGSRRCASDVPGALAGVAEVR